MTFFSDFQSKFPAKYTGQYIEAIIKSIAKHRLETKSETPEILKPFFQKLNIKSPKDINIDSEIPYEGLTQNRRCDLLITFTTINERPGNILIEIKVEDEILKPKSETDHDQLDDYLNKLNTDEDAEYYFILLTAHPISHEDQERIKQNNGFATHLYFSDYIRMLKKVSNDSIEAFFIKFLTEQGYIMYKPNEEDQEDFLSFMALCFLQHNNGHGRIVSDRKISNGPLVFSNLVKNWQLISYRLNQHIKSKGTPAIRYLPEQNTRIDPNEYEINNKSYTKHRIAMRRARIEGRIWLSSEAVIEDPKRLSWTVIYSIKKGDPESRGVNSIKCKHIVSTRTGGNVHLEKTGKEIDFNTYCKLSPEKIIEELKYLIHKMEEEGAGSLLK